MAFLERYAQYAKQYFQDPGLDIDVVPMEEARERLATIKAQPLPEVRKRIPLTNWRWLGYRDGENEARTAEIASWGTLEGVRVEDGTLRVVNETAPIVRTIPAQSWRFFLEWRVKLAAGGHAEFKVGSAAVLALAQGRLSYIADGIVVDAAPCTDGEWHALKVEIDLEERRYNLILDKTTVADFVPLAAPDTARAESFILAGSLGTQFDDVWGVGYARTDTPRQPYTIATFIDESFALKPDISGWSNPDYADAAWNPGQTPIIHGGERHAGEDLYLRTTVEVEGFERAALEIEALEPEGDLFINGERVAHIPATVPTRIDVSEFLLPDRPNTLALRVAHTKRTEPYCHHSPLDLNVGWYAARMWLDLTTTTYIDEALTHAETVGDPAYVQSRVTLQNSGSQDFSGSLGIRVVPWFPEEREQPSGEISVPVAIPAAGQLAVEPIVAVSHPMLWSPDTPNLYSVTATLYDENQQAIDDYVLTTGIRTVDQGGGTFRINGDPELSTGALLLGFRPPLDQIVVTRAWSPDDWIVRELLQIQQMGANTARTGFLLASNPRFAEIGDQLGVMFIWETTAGRWWGDPMEVDFDNYPAYMRQAYNHPSIIMWEVVNEPSVSDYGHLNDFYAKAYEVLSWADRSRLICLCSNLKSSKYSGNDSGTIDMSGQLNPGPHAAAWTASMVTRSHHIHPTGYGAPWTVLRNWPGPEADFLNSTDRAYFNTEHEESIGQPNWSFDKGKPSYKVHSYEWTYDEGSIGRKLTADEWQTSQGWQAFSAYESMRRQRIFDIDGFSWCCLHGGANSATYQKPLLDFYGHAKLAYWAVRMANQDVLAGSADVDVVYGPGDAIRPLVLNLGGEKHTDVTIDIKDLNGTIVATATYEGVTLPAGRTVTALPDFSPSLPPDTYYAIEYTVR